MSETAQAAETTEVQSPEEVKKAIHPAFDNMVDVKDAKFHFKKDDLGNKRPTVELKIPVPSVEGLVRILETGGKGLELLLSSAMDVVIAQARSILNDNEAMTEKDFPLDQLLWDAIANLPEAEKRGRGIAKEIWDAFGKDYATVMPGITGKNAEQIGNAVKLFLNKFQVVKSNKPVIGKLKEQLAIYATNSPNAEEFGEVIKFLSDKADTLLAADETAMLNNL